jgi:restriction system protein
MSVWLVRAGKYGEREQTALDKSLVTIGWNELPDLSAIKDREGLTNLYRQSHPGASSAKVANHVGQLWAFRGRIQEGDLAVLPLKTRSAIAIGKVTGPYRYATDLGEGTRHVRKVEWLRTDLPPHHLRPRPVTFLRGLHDGVSNSAESGRGANVPSALRR